jgi:uncharacterized protein
VRLLVRRWQLRRRVRGVRVVSGLARGDRFGLTWHPSIAAGVLAHLDRIDVLEVIPEGRFLESRGARRALRRLACTRPVSIHGVSLGLATVSAVDPRRLEAFARLIGEVQPESWSEHLAFVRAGGVELGHLAAPPRTALSVEAIAEHVELARRIIGSHPALENVATPIDPPGSDRSEPSWLVDVLDATPADLLLDLHNLYANGVNFGFDPAAALRALPVERIRSIHIAGGVDVRTVEGQARVLDDHLHDVPDPVYALLELVGERVPHAVDVVLERDGAFPAFESLLAQLDRARAALERGRARAAAGTAASSEVRLARGAGACRGHSRQLAVRLEGFLARVYTDAALRDTFLDSPVAVMMGAGFALDEAQPFAAVDRAGIRLAAASFAHKRGKR